MAAAILVFAKAPIAGKVKTRLQPTWTLEQAAALHRAFVADLLDRLTVFQPAARIELHTDIPTDPWWPAGVTHHLQTKGDLGQRMLCALETALASRASPVMILGGDVPSVPLGHLAAILETDADVVLGPSTDGGYYAISCRRTHPRMFASVAWSTPSALDATAEAARACGLSVSLGPAWFDIDSPEDLERLLASHPLPRHTAALLEQWQTAAR
jgi:rSAM/selenodomain-associated transferase 1